MAVNTLKTTLVILVGLAGLRQSFKLTVWFCWKTLILSSNHIWISETSPVLWYWSKTKVSSLGMSSLPPGLPVGRWFYVLHSVSEWVGKTDNTIDTLVNSSYEHCCHKHYTQITVDTGLCFQFTSLYLQLWTLLSEEKRRDWEEKRREEKKRKEKRREEKRREEKRREEKRKEEHISKQTRREKLDTPMTQSWMIKKIALLIKTKVIYINLLKKKQMFQEYFASLVNTHNSRNTHILRN